jgi:hypothetical protein
MKFFQLNKQDIELKTKCRCEISPNDSGQFYPETQNNVLNLTIVKSCCFCEQEWQHMGHGAIISAAVYIVGAAQTSPRLTLPALESCFTFLC